MAHKGKGRLFLGLLLLALGGAFLAMRLTTVRHSHVILLALGLAFALYGVFLRRLGPLVPGCILTGLGAGMLLGERLAPLGQWTLGGLGGGFLLLFLLAAVLGLGWQVWAAVVGLALTGVAFAVQLKDLLRPEVMVAVRTYWPVLLVVAGGYLVVRELFS